MSTTLGIWVRRDISLSNLYVIKTILYTLNLHLFLISVFSYYHGSLGGIYSFSRYLFFKSNIVTKLYYLPIYSSVYLCVCQSVCLSLCLSTYLLTYLRVLYLFWLTIIISIFLIIQYQLKLFLKGFLKYIYIAIQCLSITL